MSHRHDTCPKPTYGNTCLSGILLGDCEYEPCDNPECEQVGHCECLCHSGKTCNCGYQWPRQEATTETTEPK